MVELKNLIWQISSLSFGNFQVQVWVDEDNEVRWEGLTKYRCLSMDMERYSKSD